MRKKNLLRAGALSLSVALTLAPTPSEALPPLVAMLVKEIVKQTFKDMLLDGLRGQGCKGIALANAISMLDLKGGGGIGALPKMPAGMAMPNLPPGMAMPNMPNMPGGAGALIGGATGAAGVHADAMSKLAGNMPPGMALTPELSAMVANMMGAPLSPAETLATIDEMTELGLLPKAIQTELKECMVVLPQTAAALGMGMGMLKPAIPQMRQAKEQMQAATPEEQDEMIALMAEQLGAVTASERKEVLEMLDGGFFPPRVAAGVRAKLAQK